ncbi:hypothetical protein [Microbacterium sp. C7(2022)]|uniref:hypothetical protein n=1 Tax=Microbacterium sp. C7(2022) TaxID=2992759 RepID=UPI00237C0221|nr:hypothetical protein [Microbacterium sp. C7(2022)]MDE0545159.1 hypothetical protein [Microbacterium sp. C7(2022)]
MTHIDPFALRALLGPHARPCRRALTGESGVHLPPFIDHHVHRHLIAPSGFAAAGIAGIVDLGGDPVTLAHLAGDGIPRVAYAGAFITAPGGYPSGRAWAPPGTVREVSSASSHPGVAGGAATAIDEQVTFGASIIKITLHAGAAPFDLDTARAIVGLAHERGRPVVAHVEGDGMLRRALDAGVDVLAHTPFSGPAHGDEIRDAVDAGQAWISTLDIHRDEPDTVSAASANLAAFAAAGGRVLYGTDLGNGELPVGINTCELAALHAAGVRGEALIASLCDPWPFTEAPAGVATFIAGDAPADLDDVPAWLGRACVVPEEELVHDE